MNDKNILREGNMKRLTVVSAFIVMIFMAACGGGAATTTATTPIPSSSTQMPGAPVSVDGGGTYWMITPAQLYSFKVKDFFLADTDTAYVGEIAGTDVFLNSDTISQNLDKFPADKNYKIVVYCTAGIKSKVVAATLVQAGYTRVMELEGGIMAWQQQGYLTTFKTRTMA
jgi:rhodanese-related sulfurtransferase